MNRISISLAALALLSSGQVSALDIAGPDGRLVVNVEGRDGLPVYSLTYDGATLLSESPLGLTTDGGDFTSGMKLTADSTDIFHARFRQDRIKHSQVDFTATRSRQSFVNSDGQRLDMEWLVGDNDVAFRYLLPAQGGKASAVIKAEATGYDFPSQTTTFITPQSDPMIGWKRTKPSYEEVFSADARMDTRSQYGRGYTFPCLFHVGDSGWVLVSETGTTGGYVGCHLSDYDPQVGYAIAFPMAGEANGIGTTSAGMALPGSTPWRTLTVADNLRPIAETTVAYDVVEPLYEPSEEYRPGRYTWSWLIWQDNSINYKDQVAFVDLAAEMGYEYCLVDNFWDATIGRGRIAELSRYALGKGVGLLLWYNSNGFENDAPQTPKNRMNTVAARRREMAWLKSIGVKGIKVDFFGGDKQHTMQLYEDILYDANDFGLQVVFHGCTLPRGWERMYPNFVASEAVLASENVYFSDWHANREAFDLTLHPFCRNAVAAMDWGGTIMNRYMSRDNRRRHPRRTTDVFEMAAAIVTQTSVQCIALQPNNLDELPAAGLDFLRSVPTAWDETRLIDGYPGRYVVMARRSGDRWYVAGLNATARPLTLTLDLPMMAGKAVSVYSDKPAKTEIEAEMTLKEAKVSGKGKLKITMQPNGGAVVM